MERRWLGGELVSVLAALLRLNSLGLDCGSLGDEGVRALARSPHLTALEWLELGRMKLSPKTREELRARFGERVKLAD